MKSRRTIAFLTAGALCLIGATAVLAFPPHAPGKRIEHALTKAGVDQGTIHAIKGQLQQLTPELVQRWMERKTALEELSQMSPGDSEGVAAKVQELMAMRAEGKQRLQEVVEDIGQNLTARQKGKLALGLANRVSRFETDCGTRVENVLERVEQVEILTESERHLIQATVEDLSPEFCRLKQRLKAKVADLREAMADMNASEVEIETILEEMKTDVRFASQLRSNAVQQVLPELSPGTQIAIAHKLTRIVNAVEVLAGF